MADQILFENCTGSEIEFKMTGLINRMGIPCGYVGFTIEDEGKFLNALEKVRNCVGALDVHGGITFNGDVERTDCLPWMASKENVKYTWIGWDYGHCGDYHPVHCPNGVEHDADDIMSDCINVIYQLINIIKY